MVFKESPGVILFAVGNITLYIVGRQSVVAWFSFNSLVAGHKCNKSRNYLISD